MNRKIVKAVALLPLICSGVKLGLYLEQSKREAPVLSSFSSARADLLHESGRAAAHAVVTSALASRLTPGTRPEFVDTRDGGIKQRFPLPTVAGTDSDADYELEGIAAVRLKGQPDKPLWVVWVTEQRWNPMSPVSGR